VYVCMYVVYVCSVSVSCSYLEHKHVNGSSLENSTQPMILLTQPNPPQLINPNPTDRHTRTLRLITLRKKKTVQPEYNMST